MLDMFSDRPLNKWPNNNNEPLEENCKWYDVTSISKFDYGNKALKRNRISNPKIKVYFGGIRKKIFNLNAFLTKHPLLFRSRGAKYLSHYCRGAYIADISCVLYHYKFEFKEFLFNDFRKELWNQKRWFVRCQCDFICDSSGKQIVDFVGKYENLQEDFNYVCNQIGISPIKLPHINRSDTKKRGLS